MNHSLYYVIPFLLLGMGLGYALGSSRTAKKYAIAAKAESEAAIIKVDTLEVKVDGAAIIQVKDMEDLTEHNVTQDQDMSDMSDRMDEQETNGGTP